MNVGLVYAEMGARWMRWRRSTRPWPSRPGSPTPSLSEAGACATSKAPASAACWSPPMSRPRSRSTIWWWDARPWPHPSGCQWPSAVGRGGARPGSVHQEVGIVGGQQTDVAIELLPLQGALAHLMVRTTLPGADVLVDEKLVAARPCPRRLALPPGRHEVTLRRPGYRAIPGDITLADGSSGEITIEVAENPAEAALVGGHIELDINQADANVAIDGVPRFRGDLTLPAARTG